MLSPTHWLQLKSGESLVGLLLTVGVALICLAHSLIFHPLRPSESEDKVQAEQKKVASQADGPGGRQLLKQILQEVKVVRQMAANLNQKPSQCSLAVLIDSVFFVFYLLTIIVFLTYMYVHWIYLVSY